MKNLSCLPAVAMILLVGILVFSHGQCATSPESERFFLMGSGKLHLKNMRNNRETRVDLLQKDGSFSEAAFTEVDRVFGFPTGEMGEHISPRLLFMLSYFADLVAPGRTVVIESGYRSPDYNDKIRKKGANAARTSSHMDGLALDFWIAGVDGKALWQTIRQQDCCGVGHYGGRTIHLDAGRPRFWEAATSGTATREPDYNRHIYLSSDYDRYRPGEALRLSLSGISTFGFGVRPTVAVFNTGEKPVAQAQIGTGASSDCLMITDHKASRFLNTAAPAGLAAGRYRLKLDFCNRPFAQMPAEIFSQEIEILHQAEK